LRIKYQNKANQKLISDHPPWTSMVRRVRLRKLR
jgi:hypothetical protein